MVQISNAKDLGTLLKQRRQEQRLTQYDLAGLSMTSESFISKVESGKGSVTIDDLIKIIELLGLVVCVNEKESGPHSIPKTPNDGPVPSIWHGYGAENNDIDRAAWDALPEDSEEKLTSI